MTTTVYTRPINFQRQEQLQHLEYATDNTQMRICCLWLFEEKILRAKMNRTWILFFPYQIFRLKLCDLYIPK